MRSGTCLTGWCNLLPTQSPNIQYASPVEESLRFGQGNQAIYFFIKQNLTTKNDFVNWLITNKVCIYYPIR